MNFQNLKSVEDYQFYLDLAFRRMREKGKKLRDTKLKGTRVEKSTYIETLKMQVVADTISSRMDAILKSFPSIDQLPDFYHEMLKLTLDYVQLKKSLGAVNWLRKQSFALYRAHSAKLKANKRFDSINQIRTSYLGRLSSLVKQIKKDFVFLEEARKIMKGFPDIKEMPSVAIVGFPNVGKTTLLYKLTGSKGEIDSYPFTTKGVNVSYLEGIQLLDTPGTLNRLEKMNNIEKIAHIALKEAETVVYVFDPLEEYPMHKQVQLYQRIKKEKKKLIVYISKKDLADEDTLQELKKKYKGILDPEQLKKEILKISP